MALYIIVPIMAIACFFVFYNKNTLKFERLIFNKLKRIFKILILKKEKEKMMKKSRKGGGKKEK